MNRLLNDTVVEGWESFGLTLTAESPQIVLGTSQQTVWIPDDDQVYVSFSPANSSVSEASGRAPVAVVVTTDRGTPTTRPVTVSDATVAGTATSGLDSGAASGTFTIPAGTAAGTTYSADIAVVNDAMTEPTETFTVSLSVPGAVASGPHTVSIINDDTSGDTTQVDLTPATQGVSEAAGVVRLTAVVTTADGRPTPSAMGLTLSTVHEWGGANRASPNVDYQAFGQAGNGAAWFSLPAGMASGAASAVPVQLVWIYDDDRAGARSFSAAGTMTASAGAGTGGTATGTGTGTGGTATGTGAGGVITLPKGPTGAPTFPRGATGGWTIERKAPAPPPPPAPAPLTWTTKGGAR